MQTSTLLPLLDVSMFVMVWACSFALLYYVGLILIRKLRLHYDLHRVSEPVFSSLLVICLFIELLKKLQEHRANLDSILLKGPPLVCSPNYGWINYLVSVFSSTDHCSIYLNALNSSVLWTLNPLKVVVSLFTDIFVLILGAFGSALGNSIAKFLDSLPFFQIVPAVAIGLGVLLLVLFFASKYEIGIGWNFMAIKPNARVDLSDHCPTASKENFIIEKPKSTFLKSPKYAGLYDTGTSTVRQDKKSPKNLEKYLADLRKQY